MTQREPQQQRLNDLINYLLDDRYEELAAPAILALSAALNRRSVQSALAALTAEAKRLQAAGIRMLPDNPVLVEITKEIDLAIRASLPAVTEVIEPLTVQAVDAANQILPARALRTTSTGGADNPFILRDAEVRAAELPVNKSNDFRDSFDRLSPYVVAVLYNQAVQGVARRWGAQRTARRIDRIARELPISSIRQSLRTAYLTSYREASRQIRLDNSDIIGYQIRVAVLDDRTCLACINLHGQRLPLTAVIADHPRGRCDSITVLKGVTHEIETGEDWLQRQPEQRQQSIMGASNWRAWVAGAVVLGDFVHQEESDLYGPMVNEASLVSILGDDAQDYYEE